MLFRQTILQGIGAGRVTLAFRRWRRAPPREGSTLRSPVGVLCLDRVTVVDEGDITPEDMRRTGMSVEELRTAIAGEGTLLRIELRRAGDDPRIALSERLPEQIELTAIVAAREDRRCVRDALDERYLQLIADQPGIVSSVLGASRLRVRLAEKTLSARRVRIADKLRGGRLGRTLRVSVGERAISAASFQGTLRDVRPPCSLFGATTGFSKRVAPASEPRAGRPGVSRV